MVCPLLWIPNFILAVFVIVGFFSKRNPLMYRSSWALEGGIVLLITTLLEERGFDSPWISLLEFTIILMAGIQIESFVSANGGKKPLYWLFGVITIIVIIMVVIAGSSDYFEVGLLVILGIATIRLSSMKTIFGREIEHPLLTSGSMAFLSALSLLLGFEGYLLSCTLGHSSS